MNDWKKNFKFQPGDHIHDSCNNKGEIEGIFINLDPEECHYHVLWDGDTNSRRCEKAAEMSWKLNTSSSSRITLPEGSTHVTFNPYCSPEAAMNHATADTHKAACSHDWAEYQGFTDAYEYCTKCDEKKG